MRSIVLVLGLIAAVQAQTYVQIDNYSGSSTCTGTASFSTFYPAGSCITTILGGSLQIDISGTSATYNVYTGKTCTGTPTATSIPSSGACVATLGKVTFPAAGSFVSAYYYSDNSCTTATYGPLVFQANICSFGGVQFQTGHTLTICSGCTSTTSGTCSDSGVTSGSCYSGGGASIKYVFNSAAAYRPVAALIAVLMACAVAVAKLL